MLRFSDGVETNNDGTIYECRRRGFEALESKPDFLKTLLLRAATARIGRSVKFSAVSSGTTVFTQGLCIEWQ